MSLETFLPHSQPYGLGWSSFFPQSKVESCDPTLNQATYHIFLAFVVSFREGQCAQSGHSGQTNLSSESFDYIIREAVFFSFSLEKKKKMKEIQSPELLKPCCDKEGDGGGGDTRLKNGWHWLPVLLLQLCNEPC